MASRGFVAFLFIGLTLVGTGNKVLGKFVTIPYANYPYYLMQLVTFFFIPSSFVWVWYAMYFKPGQIITPAMREIPQKVWLTMGLLDGFSMLLGIFSNTFISNGATLTLLSQFAIPVSMVLSVKFLGHRYTNLHYISVVVILASIGIVMLPTFLGSNGAGGGGGNLPPTTDAWYWYVVSLAQWIPATFSYVYKERTLKDIDLDPLYLNGWVAVYQFLFGILVCVPAGFAVGIGPSDLPRNIYNGALCTVGINSLDSDNCFHTGPIFTSMFLVDVVFFNLFLILMIKYGSTTWMIVSQTIVVPLGTMAFAVPWPLIDDSNVAPIDGFLIGGLCLLMVGLFLFNEMHKMLPCSSTPTETPPEIPSEAESLQNLLGTKTPEHNVYPLLSSPFLGAQMHIEHRSHYVHIHVDPSQVVQARNTNEDHRDRYFTAVLGTRSPRKVSALNSSDSPPASSTGRREILIEGGATTTGFLYSTSVGIDGRPKSPSRYFKPQTLPPQANKNLSK